MRCRWVAGVRVCGGEGPRDAAKRGGGAAPGPPQQIGPTACLTQPRQWFHHLLPKYLITGDRKSPLENWDPPSPLLRAPVAPTPAASDTPLQPGLCTCLLPGAWEMLSQVGDAVGDRGAGSAQRLLEAITHPRGQGGLPLCLSCDHTSLGLSFLPEKMGSQGAWLSFGGRLHSRCSIYTISLHLLSLGPDWVHAPRPPAALSSE